MVKKKKKLSIKGRRRRRRRRRKLYLEKNSPLIIVCLWKSGNKTRVKYKKKKISFENGSRV